MVSVGGFWKLLWELAATNLSLGGKHITWTAVYSWSISKKSRFSLSYIDGY